LSSQKTPAHRPSSSDDFRGGGGQRAC
jgi:hypothetical protein